MARETTISLELGSEQISIERFEAVEALSELFVLTADAVNKNAIDFLPHLTKDATITVTTERGAVRVFHGLLTEAELTNVDQAGSHYRLTLRPWLYLLDQNRNYRIFQDKTVPDIAKQIFADHHIRDYDLNKLTGQYQTREYCVQYHESDFQFLSRLFESEGIYYYFSHGDDGNKLILCDSAGAHQTASGYASVPFRPAIGEAGGLADTIWEWRERVSTTAQGKVAVRFYDFARPSAAIDKSAEGEAQHPSDEMEVYDYVGDFANDSVAETAGKMKLQSGRARRQVYHGVGDAPGLACGGLFSLTDGDPSRLNQSYLIAGLRTELTAQSYRSNGAEGVRRVYVEAIPSSTEFRPAHKTPRPRAAGPETATVVTPDGKPVYVDSHGRVRVRFHWDRRDKSSKGDDTCWLRVSHGAAGAGYGMVNLPRLNHEVIVDFLQGDPDRPIITGHVYDPDRTHPYAPDQNMTVSAWKTQTVGDAGSYDGAENQPPSGTAGFNEIRLEDKGGSEEVYIHAQRAMLTEVLLDDKLTVQRDRDTRIGRNRTTAVKNNETFTLDDGDETHTVSTGKRVTTIKANDELTVQQGDHKTTVSQGDQTTTVSQGDQTTTVSMGNITVKASMGQITVEAMQSITLKVGGNSVVIDQTGVTVKGVMVTSEAQATNTVKGPMVEVQGSGMTTVKGGLVMIN